MWMEPCFVFHATIFILYISDIDLGYWTEFYPLSSYLW